MTKRNMLRYGGKKYNTRIWIRACVQRKLLYKEMIMHVLVVVETVVVVVVVVMVITQRRPHDLQTVECALIV
jgi:hypothetical protein